MRKTFTALSLLGALLICGCAGSHQGSLSPQAPVTSRPSPSGTQARPQTAMGSIAPPGWGLPAPASAHLYAVAPRSTVTMYDSVSVATIPRDPFAAAGYTGGAWRTAPILHRLYPSTHVISIAVFPWEHADCADVEPGDLAPWEAPGWVRADERAGYRKPCLYSDWSEWVTELAPTLARAGIVRSTYYGWVASYVGHPQLLAGFEADQWTDTCFGRNLDCSLVLRSFLAIARPPLIPRPKPAPRRKQLERQLHAALTLWTVLRALEQAHHCRQPPYHAAKPPRYEHACHYVWVPQGRAVDKQIAALEAKLR